MMAQVLGNRRAMVTDSLLHLLAACCGALLLRNMRGQMKFGGAGQKCLSQGGASAGAEDAAAHGVLCSVPAACNCAPSLSTGAERNSFLCVALCAWMPSVSHAASVLEEFL